MSLFPQQKLYIHGDYVESSSQITFTTLNPANGEVLAEVQCAGKNDIEKAVASATAGQKVWAAMTAMQRSRILRRAVDILRERNDELALLETLDTGKPLSEPVQMYLSIMLALFPLLKVSRFHYARHLLSIRVVSHSVL